MTFQEAEKTYEDLRSQHANRKLSDADFYAQVNQLKVLDAQGRWWQVGVRSGEWYVSDGQNWVQAKPYSDAQTLPPMPVAPPEDPEPSQVERADRSRVLPRGLASPNPERINRGGSPRPLMIGCIAVVALVVVGLIAGGVFLFGGSLSGGASARATSTPSQAIALLPTPAATSIAIATDTPLSPITLGTATSTIAESPTANAPTDSAATSRPNTPTPRAIAATATPALAPGIYVTKLTADNISTEENKYQFVFKATFVNSTGAMWHNPSEFGWVVLVFQVNNQDRSYGQTRIVKEIDIPPGTNVITITDPWNVGPAANPDCIYIAGVYYLDYNSARVPFLQPNGKQFRLNFTTCK